MFLFINFSNNISCITFQLSEIDEQISIYNLQVYSMNFQYLVFLKTKLPREKFWKAIVSFTAMVQRIAHYFSSALTLALNDFARLEPPSLLTLSRDILFLFTPSLYFIFPLWSISAYELSHPAVDHAVCILRIASLLSACLTISLSHFLPPFPPLNPSFARSLSLSRSFSHYDSRSASSRRDEVRGKLKYADFYRRPRAVNERMGEPGMKNEKGLDHKGCGRPDFTGQTCPRQLSNF